MDLGSILSIPFTGDCPFTLKEPVYSPLSPLYQLQTIMDDPTLTSVILPKTIDVSPIAIVLHKLLRYNLLPRIGGGAEFTYQDLVLVALLLKGKPFNFSLMMLKHMVKCIKHSKKCLPYSCFLTKLFTHCQIPLDNEGSITITDSIDSVNLKSSHITLVDGTFMQIAPDAPSVPQVTNFTPSAPPTPSPKILTLLNTLVTNQTTLHANVKDIQHRLSVLEKGTLPISRAELRTSFRNVEDEFIDLHAEFELYTRAMVEALQRKMNRNACQLSTKLKFICNQIGSVG